MCDQAGCAIGPSGQAGELDASARDDMATFLQAVSYPPPRSRPPSDQISASARDGFADFFLDQNGGGGALTQTCADTTGGCHALPLGTSTNSPAVGAFEAPTMRGMTDRFLQFSGGFTAPQELLDLVAGIAPAFGVIAWNPAAGLDERTVFSAAFPAFNPLYGVLPGDMFQMFEEASVGHSGALGRMVTVNQSTATGGSQAETYALLDVLEAADARGVVNVYGAGVHEGQRVSVSYRAELGVWQVGSEAIPRAALEQAAENGDLRFTVTAHLPRDHGAPDHPQPLLDVATVGSGPGGDPDVPLLTGGGGGNPIGLRGVSVRADARVLVDGAPDLAGSVTCTGGSFAPFCDSEQILVDLSSIPGAGLHLLQLQNGDGPLSDELPFCVGPLAGCL